MLEKEHPDDRWLCSGNLREDSMEPTNVMVQ
jgi:hypothetical protein